MGTDPRTDLAVVKVDAGRELPFLTLGDSTHLKVASWVMAVGAPFELEQMEGGNAEPLLKSTVTAPFLSAYREHIDCEEEQAYPLAFQDASEEQQRAWGEEMAQRRISQPKLG